MVNYIPDACDAIFAALSDPTRRGMVSRLARGPATVGELGRPYPISKPAVSKHVKVLERAGLLTRARHGREHRCELNAAALLTAEAWLDRQRRFWSDMLESLDRYLTEGEDE